MRLGRACLVQSKVPEGLLHYAIRHVKDARKAVKNTTNISMPLESAFGHPPPYNPNMRLFGCQALYRLTVDLLPTFEGRVQDGIYLLHKGGGVRRVLTGSGPIRPRTFPSRRLSSLVCLNSTEPSTTTSARMRGTKAQNKS